MVRLVYFIFKIFKIIYISLTFILCFREKLRKTFDKHRLSLLELTLVFFSVSSRIP